MSIRYLLAISIAISVFGQCTVLGQEPVLVKKFPDFPKSVAFSPDAKLVAVSHGAGRVIIMEITTGKVVHEMLGCRYPIAFSADGKFFCTIFGCTSRGQDVFDVSIYEVPTFREKRRFLIKNAQNPALISKDWKNIVAWGRPDTDKILVTDMETGKLRFQLDRGAKHRTFNAAISPDGKYLAMSGSPAGVIRWWDLQKGKEVRQWKFPNSFERPMAFGPDGRTLITAGSNLSVIEVATVRRLGGAPFGAGLVAVCPKTGNIVGTAFGCLVFHEGRNGRRFFQFVHSRKGGSSCVAYSPDGEFIGTGDMHGYFKVWRVSDILGDLGFLFRQKNLKAKKGD